MAFRGVWPRGGCPELGEGHRELILSCGSLLYPHPQGPTTAPPLGVGRLPSNWSAGRQRLLWGEAAAVFLKLLGRMGGTHKRPPADKFYFDGDQE